MEEKSEKENLNTEGLPGNNSQESFPEGDPAPGDSRQLAISTTQDSANKSATNMETHAQHLHKAPGNKFWHYFYEFLMLFLAVFCGFIAENIREHALEREKEKEYMKGMVADLATDTAKLNRIISFSDIMLKGIDSLTQNLYLGDLSKENTLSIYRQCGSYLRKLSVGFSDQTATQLRNAGALRLIRKGEVSNGISNYWNGIRAVESIEQSVNDLLDEIGSFSDNILNKHNYLKSTDEDTSSHYHILKVNVDPSATLMTTEKNTLITFANKITRFRNRIQLFYIDNVSDQKKQAVFLLELINKEYHLE